MITGSEALWLSLIQEGVDTVFGYPGGQIMPVYDSLCDYQDKVRHILVRHEQGAIHAAQGYARVGGNPGVVIVTSGPGATNVITGVHDAMTDSTPVVVITGQVSSAALGTDAFQEADVIGLTGPISKWNYQIRTADEVAWAVARAFYIARTGRPGPVVLDFTKDAQVGLTDFKYEKCNFIRSYVPDPKIPDQALHKAVALLNAAERPFLVFGQGVVLGRAEKELEAFLRKGDIPCGSTLLGLSALPSDFPLYRGMIGMHGNIAPNMMTNACDVLIAVGMRFDDRVTGTVATYARQAKVIHIDIDPSEIGKIIPVEAGIRGDAKKVLALLTEKMEERRHPEWNAGFDRCDSVEKEVVIDPEVHPADGMLRMGEVVDSVVGATGNKAVVVTDVGQNQMMGARYSRFSETRSFISSGGLGTMGFGLPAAIGAKIAAPARTVCLFVGDGGIQMTMQEFGTIMQEQIGVKVVLLNNNWLGNVRQWQEMFFGQRYSQTRMINPDYAMIARAYGIRCVTVERREELEAGLEAMFADDAPFILDVHVLEEGMVMPMVPPGKGINQIMITESEWYRQ
ncbi:MAG: biosynthetic-type acetolactate synthase large subunit [Bacteroidales bacterium]|nr:biosynthetic-type acetolactate synthase large subunit [Bacteroidales bacterium]MBR2228415.1 biosynthetic-type acetolactate synthase large subunit [Bacteroidales bacterium]MBR3097394.1 biosynthetic-type acetolactate synthase large subunit [Bacteroidales bacterium]MBR4687545.1 biosynthetic-type acetolactate synthase large subunit [Bacteroidales bacterium]